MGERRGGCAGECSSAEDEARGDHIFDSGFPRGLVAGEPGAITFTRHDMGVGVDIVEDKPRNPLRRGPRGPRYTGVRRRDVPLVTALRILQESSSSLGLSRSIVETAGLILSAYYRGGGRSPGRPEPLVAAAILKACEIHNVAVAQGEVLELLGVTTQELWRARSKLAGIEAIRSLQAQAIRRGRGGRLLERTYQFVDRIVGELGLPGEVAELARKVVEASLRAERRPGLRKDLHGKKPEAVAAAAVYLAARLLGRDDVTQKAVAEVVKLRESNVRKHYRFLIDNVAIVVYV